jgi:hypothetical protein
MNDVFLNGKTVILTGGNAINNIKDSYPELFRYKSFINSFSLEFPEDIQVSFTSIEEIDTDYHTVQANKIFAMGEISVLNIKIKSTNGQTGYIYTAGI